MPALRLMTFNIQMLPLIATAIEGQSERAEDIAKDVAAAIFSLPKAEQPDIIAFNEAFNEDGRSKLKTLLSSTYSNVIEKIFDGLFEDDAGLMLFSKLPLLPVPTGGLYFEHIYDDHDGDDSHASKAVGVIQVATPVDKTTIAFTHLQASYDTEDQYDDVRAKQLDAVFDAIETVLAGDAGNRGRVVFMGDLNIRGDKDAVSGEWGSVFEGGATQLFGSYLDGWHAYMHPPGSDCIDQGITNVDFEKSIRQRLDYMCFAKPGAADILLVPQHMRVRIRNPSDHFALESVVQRVSAHSTPSDAIEALGIPPKAGGTAGLPTSVRQVDVNFEFDGSYQWIFVKKPGTYTFNCSDGLNFEVYLVSDLSHPVTRLDTLDVRLLPSGLEAGFHEREFDPRGETFLCREPFWILAKAKPGFTGPGIVWVTEHQGESDVTAIALLLFDKVESSFPPGQTLGDDDVCWFRADMPKTFQGNPRTEMFDVDNSSGGSISVDVLDSAFKKVSPAVSGSNQSLKTMASVTGGERIFLTIRRSNLSLTGFSIVWRSPVSYLDLDEPLFLYIKDESGPDWPGADEPELQINIDTGGSPVFQGSWDDADTGERWPGLHEAVAGKIATVMPGVRRVGFVEGIWLGYVEPDFNAQGWVPEAVNALTSGEPDRVTRTVSMAVPDVVSNGLYTFTCTITRFPF